MSEFLEPEQIQTLTACAPPAKQGAWLTGHGIPMQTTELVRFIYSSLWGRSNGAHRASMPGSLVEVGAPAFAAGAWAEGRGLLGRSIGIGVGSMRICAKVAATKSSKLPSGASDFMAAVAVRLRTLHRQRNHSTISRPSKLCSLGFARQLSNRCCPSFPFIMANLYQQTGALAVNKPKNSSKVQQEFFIPFHLGVLHQQPDGYHSACAGLSDKVKQALCNQAHCRPHNVVKFGAPRKVSL